MFKTECSIRVSMTAFIEYIDLFLLNVQKGEIMLQISFKCQHNSGILVLQVYAQNYSSIIPAPLNFIF